MQAANPNSAFFPRDLLPKLRLKRLSLPKLRHSCTSITSLPAVYGDICTSHSLAIESLLAQESIRTGAHILPSCLGKAIALE